MTFDKYLGTTRDEYKAIKLFDTHCFLSCDKIHVCHRYPRRNNQWKLFAALNEDLLHWLYYSTQSSHAYFVDNRNKMKILYLNRVDCSHDLSSPDSDLQILINKIKKVRERERRKKSLNVNFCSNL